MDIFQEIKNRAVDYEPILKSCYQCMPNPDARTMAIIIPVFKRTQFTKVICENFKNAIRHFYPMLQDPYKQISLTIVEHSPVAEHKELVGDWVNYVWIKNEGTFNKSLAYNVGGLLNRNAGFLLFHDLDTVVPKDFLARIGLNLERSFAITPLIDCDENKPFALQCFTGRRLQLCNNWITNEIIEGRIPVDEISNHPGHIQPAQPGAKGGSILVHNKTFFNTTFCPEIFNGYGLEDAFFWDCIATQGHVSSCDAPPIELYHLAHDAHRVTKDIDWTFYNAFNSLAYNEKRRFIAFMASNVKKHLNETTHTNI